MKNISDPRQKRGASLIEAIIAVGVLSVAIPLVFGALAESGKTNVSSEAETRSIWIVPACVEEIQASRDGRSQYFNATRTGDEFPPAGEVWALGFSAEGKPVGKISKPEYEKGTRDINGEPVKFLASLSSETITEAGVTPVMLRARITLEYPATSPEGKRQKLDFYTRIP